MIRFLFLLFTSFCKFAGTKEISQIKLNDGELSMLGGVLDELHNRKKLNKISKECNKYGAHWVTKLL